MAKMFKLQMTSKNEERKNVFFYLYKLKNWFRNSLPPPPPTLKIQTVDDVQRDLVHDL